MPAASWALEPPAAPDEGLVRALGLGSTILLVLRSVIGSGIFLTTGVMAAALPSATLLLLAWAARVWGYPVVPIVFITASGAFVLNTLIERPQESFAGLGLLAPGLPVYWYSNR